MGSDSISLNDAKKWRSKALLTLRLMVNVMHDALTAARASGETESLVQVSDKLTKLAVQGGVGVGQ